MGLASGVGVRLRLKADHITDWVYIFLGLRFIDRPGN